MAKMRLALDRVIIKRHSTPLTERLGKAGRQSAIPPIQARRSTSDGRGGTP